MLSTLTHVVRAIKSRISVVAKLTKSESHYYTSAVFADEVGMKVNGKWFTFNQPKFFVNVWDRTLVLKTSTRDEKNELLVKFILSPSEISKVLDQINEVKSLDGPKAAGNEEDNPFGS